jgi:tRNA threonylcarbamoyladenosine biosynthesis protein TsaB
MNILAIDTAGVDCAAAVYDASTDKLLAAVTDRIGKGHAERLMAMIDDVLDEAGLPLQAIGRVAVTIGPGSFTGIRVGVAAARGLALALPAEVVGVTTLETLAQAHLATYPGQAVIAAMDAKRHEIYAQAFDGDGHPLTEPCSLSLDELRSLAKTHDAVVCGSAAALLDGEAAASEPDRFDIAIVARVAAKALVEMARPKPLYLRGPDAKPQDGFALARA